VFPVDGEFMAQIFRVFSRQFKFFLRKQVGKIAEINRKYAHPRLAVKKNTAFALLMLRLYLLFLVALLIYKFILTVRGK
jgi:hypothetical protein